jgi:hypothetical protein
MPTGADQAPTGTYIGVITREGLPPNASSGLSFIVDANGVVMRSTGEIWTLRGIGSGVAAWGRLSPWNDLPEFNPEIPRIDFEINADDGVGLWIANPSISVGLAQDVPFFNYYIPG